LIKETDWLVKNLISLWEGRLGADDAMSVIRKPR